MAPLPVVPGVLKIELLWDVGADLTAATILHWAYTGTPPTDATAAAIATDVFGFAATDLLPLLSAENELRNCQVTDLSTVSGGQGDVSTGGGTGTRSGAPLGASSAALFSYKILRRYRGGKPRSYFPFGVGNDLTTGLKWTGTFISAAEAAIASLYASISTIVESSCTLTHQVSVSYYSGFTVAINPVTGRARNISTKRVTPLVDQVVQVTCQPSLGSQRRRNQQKV